MGRPQDLRIVDPVLTELLRGYSNAELIGHNLFPIVGNLNKETGKIPTFGKEAFMSFNTERAMRANSNKMPVEARSTVDFTMTEHDATYPVDYREIEEDMLDTEAYAAYRAQSAIMLRHELACAELAQNDSLYPSGSKITLTSSGQFTHADSDPFATVSTAVEAVRGKIAKRPNVGVMGASVFKTLQNHPKVLERLKYSQLGVVTLDLLKALFNIPNLFVGDAVKASDASVLSDIWSDNFILAYVPEMKSNVSRSIYEPSFGYTLRKKGMPQADKYDDNGGKIHNVRSTDNFVVKIVGADAGYIMKDCNA